MGRGALTLPLLLVFLLVVALLLSFAPFLDGDLEALLGLCQFLVVAPHVGRWSATRLLGGIDASCTRGAAHVAAEVVRAMAGCGWARRVVGVVRVVAGKEGADANGIYGGGRGSAVRLLQSGAVFCWFGAIGNLGLGDGCVR